LVLPVGQQR